MAFKKLKVYVGGLCLIVQRAGKGMFFLMPNVPSDCAPHVPLLLAHPDNTASGATMVYPLRVHGRNVDLFDLAASDDSAIKTLDVLNVSEYTKTPVHDDWLDIHATPVDPLVARVRLPLGPQFTPAGNAGLVSVGHSKTVPVYGRGYLTIDVTNGQGNLPVPEGPPLTPDANQTITVQFLNIPMSQLHRTAADCHNIGDEILHPQAYYSLLEGNPSGPSFYVGEKVAYGEKEPQQMMPLCDPKYFGPADGTGRYVDTHDCTLGGGT